MTITLTPDSVDKWFKTRNGRKAKCVFNPPAGYLFVETETLGMWTVSSNGCHSRGVDDLDIISEWREPIEKEVTINLGCNGNVWIGDSCDNSRPDAYPIASTKVKLTEGVFHHGQ